MQARVPRTISRIKIAHLINTKHDCILLFAHAHAYCNNCGEPNYAHLQIRMQNAISLRDLVLLEFFLNKFAALAVIKKELS